MDGDGDDESDGRYGRWKEDVGRFGCPSPFLSRHGPARTRVGFAESGCKRGNVRKTRGRERIRVIAWMRWDGVDRMRWAGSSYLLQGLI
jgi:hypothetical protein